MPFMMESAIDPGGDLDMTMYVVLSAIGLCLECMAYTKLYQASIRWYARRHGETNHFGRASDVFGIMWSGLFVLTGLLVMIPVFGVFGIIWTLGAGTMTVSYAKQLLGKRRSGPKPGEAGASPDARRRLEQLETLKAAGLLTGEEYREKRREILEEL